MHIYSVCFHLATQQTICRQTLSLCIESSNKRIKYIIIPHNEHSLLSKHTKIRHYNIKIIIWATTML